LERREHNKHTKYQKRESKTGTRRKNQAVTNKKQRKESSKAKNKTPNYKKRKKKKTKTKKKTKKKKEILVTSMLT
jgi:hypothetical protein